MHRSKTPRFLTKLGVTRRGKSLASPHWADRATRPTPQVRSGLVSSAVYNPPYYTRTAEMFDPVQPSQPPLLITRKKRNNKPNDGRVLRRSKPTVSNNSSDLTQSVYAPTGKTLVRSGVEIPAQSGMTFTEKLYDDRLSARVFSTGGGAALGAAAGASSCGAYAIEHGAVFFVVSVAIGTILGIIRGYRNA